MMRPFVKLTYSRGWVSSPLPAETSSGVMNLVQTSTSDSVSRAASADGWASADDIGTQFGLTLNEDKSLVLQFGCFAA